MTIDDKIVLVALEAHKQAFEDYEAQHGTPRSQEAAKARLALVMKIALLEAFTAAADMLPPTFTVDWEPLATMPHDIRRIVWVCGGRFRKPQHINADGAYWREEAPVEERPTHWAPWQPYPLPLPPVPSAGPLP